MTSLLDSPLSKCDPEEIVTASHLTVGRMALRSAVQQTLALPESKRQFATIFREGIPPILDINDIKKLAQRANFQV
jgi:hypothetical protein